MEILLSNDCYMSFLLHTSLPLYAKPRRLHRGCVDFTRWCMGSDRFALARQGTERMS